MYFYANAPDVMWADRRAAVWRFAWHAKAAGRARARPNSNYLRLWCVERYTYEPWNCTKHFGQIRMVSLHFELIVYGMVIDFP
jgi:hypothetical protein